MKKVRQHISGSRDIFGGRLNEKGDGEDEFEEEEKEEGGGRRRIWRRK